MEFDWSLYRSTGITQDEMSESFEDSVQLPAAARLQPLRHAEPLSQPRLHQRRARASSRVYTSTGKIVRVVAARPMTEEETFFYEQRSQMS